jgi:hypothetical protein
LCDGDSGSWVVDSRTYQVYGHLIASDALGGGYVTPLHASLEEMATLMEVQKAQLPTDIDVFIKLNNLNHDGPEHVQFDSRTPSLQFEKKVELLFHSVPSEGQAIQHEEQLSYPSFEYQPRNRYASSPTASLSLTHSSVQRH